MFYWSCYCVKVIPCWLAASGVVLLKQSVRHNQLSDCEGAKGGRIFFCYAWEEELRAGVPIFSFQIKDAHCWSGTVWCPASTTEPVVKRINSGCLRHAWAESVPRLPAHFFTCFIPQRCSRKGGVLCLYSGDDLQHWLHGGVIVFLPEWAPTLWAV